MHEHRQDELVVQSSIGPLDWEIQNKRRGMHLNLPQRQESRIALDGFADELGRLSLSLCSQDGALLVLLCFVHLSSRHA